MKWRVHFTRALTIGSLFCCGFLASRPARAQTTSETLFLLLPVGARAIGMGEAAVATRGGTESVWWNPSGVAGDSTPEIGLHHSTTVIGQGNALSFVLPTRHIGTFVPSIGVLDLDEQESTDAQGNRQGIILPTDVVFSLTYAASLSRELSAGVTLKHVEARVRCSGICTDLPTGGSSSGGADVGAQLRFPTTPLTIGVAARNLGVGPKDSRASRFDVGANYRVTSLERYTQEIQLYAASSVVSTTRFDSVGVRLGGDVVFEGKIHVRGGYTYDHLNGSGTSIGFGVEAGKFAFDLARRYGGSVLSIDSDTQPTYFSLQYAW